MEEKMKCWFCGRTDEKAKNDYDELYLTYNTDDDYNRLEEHEKFVQFTKFTNSDLEIPICEICKVIIQNFCFELSSLEYTSENDKPSLGFQEAVAKTIKDLDFKIKIEDID